VLTRRNGESEKEEIGGKKMVFATAGDQSGGCKHIKKRHILPTRHRRSNGGERNRLGR